MNITTSTIRHAFAAAGLAVLTACGGGGGATTAPATADQASSTARAAPQIVVSYNGDSIARTEADSLAALNPDLTVVGYRRGSMTLRQFVEEGHAADAAKSGADVVVISYGANDAYRNPLAYDGVDVFRAALELASTQIRLAGPRVVIETATWYAGNAANMAVWDQAMREAARLSGAYVCDRAAATAGTDASLYIDGVHPGWELTTANAERLGACVGGALKG